MRIVIVLLECKVEGSRKTIMVTSPSRRTIMVISGQMLERRRRERTDSGTEQSYTCTCMQTQYNSDTKAVNHKKSRSHNNNMIALPSKTTGVHLIWFQTESDTTHTLSLSLSLSLTHTHTHTHYTTLHSHHTHTHFYLYTIHEQAWRSNRTNTTTRAVVYDGFYCTPL